ERARRTAAPDATAPRAVDGTPGAAGTIRAAAAIRGATAFRSAAAIRPAATVRSATICTAADGACPAGAPAAAGPGFLVAGTTPAKDHEPDRGAAAARPYRTIDRGVP